MEETTDLFGIPIPSSNKVFLTFVIIHILIAMACVISGLVAMLSEKGSRQHSLSGKVYLWCMLSTFATVVILSVMRWPHNIHLLVIGICTTTFTYTGYELAKPRKVNRTRLHTICMGLSYIFLLTGFYVDNGKNLPFWNQFHQIVFYVFPSVIGIPIIIYVLIKHPLNRLRWSGLLFLSKKVFFATLLHVF